MLPPEEKSIAQNGRAEWLKESVAWRTIAIDRPFPYPAVKTPKPPQIIIGGGPPPKKIVIITTWNHTEQLDFKAIRLQYETF